MCVVFSQYICETLLQQQYETKALRMQKERG